MKRALPLLIVSVFAGCATPPKPINADEFKQTRLISHADVDRLPSRISVSGLIARWGYPDEVGREAILSYKTDIDGVFFLVYFGPEGNDYRNKEVKRILLYPDMSESIWTWNPLAGTKRNEK